MNTSPKQRIANGEQLAGGWIAMFSPIGAEIMANAGYDFAMIDLEHGPGSYTEAIVMIQALESRGCAPMIRASSANIVDIKRVLDLGPAGIMVPNVRNAEEARAVVAHCRYGPAGDRGAAPGYIRATDYLGGDPVARNGKPYAEFMEKDFLLMVQVESSEALDQVEAIAEVEGIDMIFIGPADLSASLGNLGGFDTEQFVQAMARIESAAKSAGKWLGNICFADWTAERLYQSGYQLVLSGADTMLLAKAAREDRQNLMAAMKK